MVFGGSPHAIGPCYSKTRSGCLHVLGISPTVSIFLCSACSMLEDDSCVLAEDSAWITDLVNSKIRAASVIILIRLRIQARRYLQNTSKEYLGTHALFGCRSNRT